MPRRPKKKTNQLAISQLPAASGEVIDRPGSPPPNGGVVTLMHASRSGPLPSPQDYRDYELAHPGSAERILSMAEKNQNHRIDMDQKDSPRQTDLQNHVVSDRAAARMERRIGQALALVICLPLIWLGFRMVDKGDSKTAGAMLSVLLVSVIIALMTGRYTPVKQKPAADDQADAGKAEVNAR